MLDFDHYTTNGFLGDVIFDDLELKFTRKDEAKTISAEQLAFVSISNSLKSFVSINQGFIGLAPYKGEVDRQLNFMAQLKAKKLISYNCFSFYIRLDTLQSYVKFGSYDELGLKDK